jgi:hypothetical protein
MDHLEAGSLNRWRPQGDSNPCRRRERANLALSDQEVAECACYLCANPTIFDPQTGLTFDRIPRDA